MSYAALGHNLNELRRASDRTCDLTLEIREASRCADQLQFITDLLVHSCVLCACSPVFKVMLHTSMTEALDRVVVIEDSNPEAMETLVNYAYIYTATFQSLDHCFDVFTAAHKYQISNLCMLCENHLIQYLTEQPIGKDEFLEILEFAEDFDLKRLTTFCYSFLVHTASRMGTWQFPTFLTHAQLFKLVMYQNRTIRTCHMR